MPLKKLAQKWNQYKYRFVPWMAVNITENSPRIVSSIEQDQIISDAAITQILQGVFDQFHQNTNSFLNRPRVETEDVTVSNLQSMFDSLGFIVTKGPSTIENAGTGVFIARGKVPKGCVVAMYPGLVYQPWEPVFLVSLRNPFLFRCANGIHIDGKDTGLSRIMYKSSAGRDATFNVPRCDLSWMGDRLINPLAVGQYVNNQTTDCPANVAYQEYDVPANFPARYMKFIPNIEARLQQDGVYVTTDSLLRAVVLVALRDICEGEELFSTYYTIVKSSEKS